jgi:hypothetical protein
LKLDDEIRKTSWRLLGGSLLHDGVPLREHFRDVRRFCGPAATNEVIVRAIYVPIERAAVELWGWQDLPGWPRWPRTVEEAKRQARSWYEQSRYEAMLREGRAAKAAQPAE